MEQMVIIRSETIQPVDKLICFKASQVSSIIVGKKIRKSAKEIFLNNKLTDLLGRFWTEVGEGGQLELVEFLLHEEGADGGNCLPVPELGKSAAENDKYLSLQNVFKKQRQKYGIVTKLGKSEIKI